MHSNSRRRMCRPSTKESRSSAMRRLLAVLVLVLATLVFATPAEAGWRHWGGGEGDGAAGAGGAAGEAGAVDGEAVAGAAAGEAGAAASRSVASIGVLP